MPASATYEERMNAYLDKSGDCWVWQGAKSDNGYGSITLGNKSFRAHRLAYETFIGEIPNGMTVHHKCANRACCNPEHLELATNRENVAEMFARKAYEARIAELEEEVAALKAKYERE
jgi:hypothetical protein